MNCFMQNIAILPIEKGKGLAENKRCLNLSKCLGDEIIVFFKVSGERQNVTAVLHSFWKHGHDS